MSKLKVWIVTPEAHRLGGTERAITEQVERWRDRFDIRLFTMHSPDMDLDGLDVQQLYFPAGPHLFRYIWWFLANGSARWLNARRLGRPDLVHSPGINSFAALAMSVHIVFDKYWERVRANAWRDLRRPRSFPRTLHRIVFWNLIRVLEHRIYSGPATIWAISAEDARELEQRFDRPTGTVPVLHHGVDAVHFSPEEREVRRQSARESLNVSNNRVILLVGNDAHKKGMDWAVDALPHLPGDVVLAIAGKPDAGPLRERARTKKVADRLTLWPSTPSITDYYAAADLLLAPSREDAFHQPGMEALACGLPLVISDKAGLSDLVEDGMNALVVHDPDNELSLAGAIRRVLDDSELARQLAEEGRRLAETHSWDENAARAGDLVEMEATTPRVLVLATDPGGTGGIQRAARTLVRAFGATFGSERVGLAPVWGLDEPLNCRTLSPGKKRRRQRVGILHRAAFLIAAVRISRRWRARLIVVATHPHLAPVARVCRFLSGAPYLVWCHGEEVWGEISPSVKKSLRNADAVFAPSRFTAERVEAVAGLREGSVQTIPHAVSPEVTAERSADRNGGERVLSVARLDPTHAYKGIEVLVKSWPIVLESHPDADLVIVGEGPDRSRLQSLAGSLHLDGKVKFVGAVSDQELSVLYASSQIFALPSRARTGPNPEGEGFGLVFCEAGAAGLPVVAGRAGAVPEVVIDGRTGILVNPESPEEVAAAILRLLRDPELARRLGDAGHERALALYSYEGFRKAVTELVVQVGRKSHPLLSARHARDRGDAVSPVK